ncbi:MAG: hypothetical protein ACUVSW_03935, partial [Roseiflexus sp.]
MAQGAVRTGDRRVWKPDQEAFGFDQGSPDDRTEGITESIQVNLITLEQRAGYVSRSLLLIDAIGAQRSTRACQSSPDRVDPGTANRHLADGWNVRCHDQARFDEQMAALDESLAKAGRTKTQFSL